MLAKMNDTLIYFIKSGLAMALFYGVYRLFLEKDTNHGLNRYYLVVTMVLSLLLPILPVEKVLVVEKHTVMPVFISMEEPAMVAPGIEISTRSGFQLSGFAVARIVYLCGITILVCTLLFQLCRLFLINKSGQERYGSLKLIFVNRDITPFSLMNRVYLNNLTRLNPNIKTIIDHEYAHFRSLHYIDLILFEFIAIFQWFNPFTWLFVRSLKEVHEYQADAAVLRNGEVTSSYKALLVNQLTGTEVFRLASGFSKSLTKKRMIMMTKIKSRKGAWLKSLLALPVLVILLVAFAANAKTMPDDDPVIIKGKVVEAASGAPLPGVSVIWEGHTSGAVTDMNGDFVLELPDRNAELVYSFVGFQTATSKGVGPHLVEMVPGTIPINLEGISSSDDAIKNELQKQKELQMKKSVLEQETKGNKEVFWVVEDLAHFPGGRPALKRYLEDNIQYPDNARDERAEVLVQFTIKADGSVADVLPKNRGNKDMDREAVRLISEMPDWIPAKQRDKPVSSQYIVPVFFEKSFGR
jgi:beta-lactamase regulating signal transducer with metallopeptidase domain